MANMEEVQREAARRQSLFRGVNDRIRELVSTDAPDFLCECVNMECHRLMEVPVAEYERVRLTPTRFFVKPGHVLAEAERVVESCDSYVVVEKVGAAEPVALELDPRGRP
jgi:hypothetical protein